jgi:hypothetical protein
MGIGGQEAYVFCPVHMYKPVPSRVGRRRNGLAPCANLNRELQ